MLILSPTTDSLEIVTSTAVSISYHISYADHTSTGVTAAEVGGTISSATTTTVLSAPAAGTTRQIRGINILNEGNSTSGANEMLVQIDVSGTNTVIYKCLLFGEETAGFTDARGWYSLSLAGRTKNNDDPPYPEGYETPLLKVGGTTEAAGVIYSPYTSALFPTAWVPGTPGLAGRAVNSEAGGLQVAVPLTGYAYLEAMVVSTSIAASVGLIDILWVNSGIAVATPTAQTINSVTFAARDLQETTVGRGVEIGILVATVTGNNVAVTTITMSYTNPDGTAGKTATISSFPATAVAGSIIPFQLAAGDNGVRSIQSITLGSGPNALVSGVIHLIAFRRVITLGCYNINAAENINWNDDGVRILSGSTMLPIQIPTAATATTMQGSVYIHNMD